MVLSPLKGMESTTLKVWMQDHPQGKMGPGKVCGQRHALAQLCGSKIPLTHRSVTELSHSTASLT